MRLEILGCSGGIGQGLRTTSLLLDDDILIDAGTGVGDLTLEAMRLIDHVFLTHSHLDHAISIPFLADAVGALRERPLVVHALEETIAILREHLFNWKLWPDFSMVPTPEKPFLRFEPLTLGETVALGTRRITALPARHTVPAIGYLLDSGRASLAFSGDTADCAAFWEVLNGVDNLRHVLIECTFRNKDSQTAQASKHYFPDLLARQLPSLKRAAEIHITHLSPGEQERTMMEIRAAIPESTPVMLERGHIFDL